MRKELAKYFVGFSYRGDRRPDAWQWKWDRRFQDNGAWCGSVEAGLPFGIDNPFYPVPGPDYPFRSMLYASAPNVGPSAAPIHAMWDRWGLNRQTKTLGYWDKGCPVKTSIPDIFASVYTSEGKALICVASWAKETTPVSLTVDWQALGLDPAHVRVSLPDIGSVQKAQETFDLSQPIAIVPGKGTVIGVERRVPKETAARTAAKSMPGMGALSGGFGGGAQATWASAPFCFQEVRGVEPGAPDRTCPRS
jgi:hypothetical protein